MLNLSEIEKFFVSHLVIKFEFQVWVEKHSHACMSKPSTVKSLIFTLIVFFLGLNIDQASKLIL